MKQSTKDYLVDRMYKASIGLANAVLVTLGIGLLIETLGTFTGWEGFITVGKTAQLMLAPAIGAGIAYQLGGNTLVIFSAMASATIGAGALNMNADGGWVLTTGQPISAVLAAVVAIWVGKKVTGKTKLDMMSIPFAAIFVGGVVGVGLAAVVTPLLEWLSAQIATGVSGSPLIGSMVIALIWSIFLMSPASSAAIAIALQLDPVSSAAALIGCTAQFAGWTAMSFRQNDIGANIAQSFLTPKVQVPNLVKNPRLVIGPFLSSLICAPIAILIFNFEVPYTLAGLGLNSFIAPLNILANQGIGVFVMYLVIGVVVPAVISVVTYQALKQKGWAKTGDLKMEVQ
ncbi:PTS sugar transporter subunit IIC [Oceanobacillus piezotolerans]|uniref:PTS sugar transporter subunit IIC n=1 Tax=Oceanobacillus piezotolerans TaxID=2448030 RepID=A0A498D243_9BACI|nr:PTS sugar transporter subunit IIC [Oceanobacillus piezotolerans]RLL40392.1 PTS sugar transporter subunit IIC [Oceanobacillus piezotolerans]